MVMISQLVNFPSFKTNKGELAVYLIPSIVATS